MRGLTLIEFTQDTYGSDGDLKRATGDRLRVDAMSAHSLVDIKKVARRVNDTAPEPDPTPAPVKPKRKPAKQTEPEAGSGADAGD